MEAIKQKITDYNAQMLERINGQTCKVCGVDKGYSILHGRGHVLTSPVFKEKLCGTCFNWADEKGRG